MERFSKIVKLLTVLEKNTPSQMSDSVFEYAYDVSIFIYIESTRNKASKKA